MVGELAQETTNLEGEVEKERERNSSQNNHIRGEEEGNTSEAGFSVGRSSLSATDGVCCEGYRANFLTCRSSTRTVSS